VDRYCGVHSLLLCTRITLGFLPATRLASRKILIEQNIKKRTGPALCVLCGCNNSPKLQHCSWRTNLLVDRAGLCCPCSLVFPQSVVRDDCYSTGFLNAGQVGMKSVEEGRTKVGRGWSADLDVSVKMLARMAVSLGSKG
jgi:hypothetical protein